MLAPGTEIRVAAGASKPIKGTIESVTDAELVLMQGKGPRSFPRPQIVSVSVKGREHRLRNALIGLGVGTVAGFAVGFAVGQSQESGCKASNGCFGLETAGAAGAGGIIGFVGGTFTGLLWPTGGWRPIYAPCIAKTWDSHHISPQRRADSTELSRRRNMVTFPVFAPDDFTTGCYAARYGSNPARCIAARAAGSSAGVT